MRLVRVGHVVQVNIDIKRDYVTGSNLVVSGLPEGYRAAFGTYRDVGCGAAHPLRFHAVGDRITAYNYNTKTESNVSGGFSYITADPFPD